jgi:hypothetical protein
MTRVRALPLAAVLLASVGGLSGCPSETSAPRGAKAGVRMGAGPALLQEVRAAGQLGNELDVQPLRDPQVEDLRTAASAAEARGDYAAAQRALAEAIQLSPTDPELLQWHAEMSLVKHDWVGAEGYATQSWERGPKLGGLCRRNWTTIRLAAESRGDAAAASQAQQRTAACAVAPPNRF